MTKKYVHRKSNYFFHLDLWMTLSEAGEELDLSDNQIGDAGVTALANAGAGGAMAQLTVSSRITALLPRLETWHA